MERLNNVAVFTIKVCKIFLNDAYYFIVPGVVPLGYGRNGGRKWPSCS